MASAFTHGFVAVAMGNAYAREPKRGRFWWTSVALSILPDADVIGFAFGVRYGDFLGHRGFSHSLLFALLAGASVLPLFRERSWKLWLYFAAVTASHGFLDAMTDGGLGIAFFSPFDKTRYFLPLRPIIVSPIGVASFFSRRGIAVLASEFLFVWIPVGLAAWAWSRWRPALRKPEEPRGGAA